jgi:hypothetical protein
LIGCHVVEARDVGHYSNGDTTWRRHNYATIHRMIDNSIYPGAHAHGKTAAASGYSADGVSAKIRRKARTDWLATHRQ